MTSDTAEVLSPQRVVEAFFADIGDLDAAFEYIADDLVYENVATVPMPTIRGKRAARRFLGIGVKLCSGFAIEVNHIAAHGSTVLTERTDTFTFGETAGNFWVCGTLEVRDGKIVAWRDYFDIGAFTLGVAGGALRAGYKHLFRAVISLRSEAVA
jgi:limonene-1,2-epoxide hydrolase